MCGHVFCKRGYMHPSGVHLCGDECRRRWKSRKQLEFQRRYRARTGRDYHARRGVDDRKRNRITCVGCGADTMAMSGARYCSRACQRQSTFSAAAERNRERIMERNAASRAAAIARRLPVLYTGPRYAYRARPLVEVHAARRLTSGRCRVCSYWFVSFHMDVTCSSECHELRQRNMKRVCRSRRRAREREAFVEDVDPIYIFERDCYRCQLCGRKTLKSKRVPHPRAPTVDHIIPLSHGIDAGGIHAPINCMCACYKCNYEKGDRPQGEQLLLIA